MAKVKRTIKVESQADSMVDYQSPVRRDLNSLYAPVMVALLVVAFFFLGRLSLEVSNLKSAKNVPTAGNPTAQQQAVAPQRPISQEAMKELAKKLGLDTNKFNSCLDDGKFAKQVASETTEGQNLGVSGTPTFFINGLMVVGAQPQTSFEAVIDAELKNGGVS